MTELADIQMRLSPNGMGEILVNGEDISDRVVNLGLQMRPGQPLVVNVQQIAGAVELIGSGVVNVTTPGAEDQQAIRRFLDRLDPSALEAKVLEEGSLDQGIMETAIQLMKKMISSDH